LQLIALDNSSNSNSSTIVKVSAVPWCPFQLLTGTHYSPCSAPVCLCCTCACRCWCYTVQTWNSCERYMLAYVALVRTTSRELDVLAVWCSFC